MGPALETSEVDCCVKDAEAAASSRVVDMMMRIIEVEVSRKTPNNEEVVITANTSGSNDGG